MQYIDGADALKEIDFYAEKRRDDLNFKDQRIEELKYQVRDLEKQVSELEDKRDS